MNYVIIGNGAAAVGTIEGIRMVDQAGAITVISTEPYPVYGRPLISYLLLGRTTEEKMLRYRPADFYEQNGVVTMFGQRVSSIDAAAKTVILDSGQAVPYDKLCICTGSRPFVPQMEGLELVEQKTSFMTLDDAKQLDAMVGNGKDRRVLIIGAGLIGLKCAEGIYQRVGELTIVDMAMRILPNVLTAEPAAMLQSHIERQGVRFLLGDRVVKFTGANSASLESGQTVEFDILVIAVGVRPNIELAAQAGCAVKAGVVIDGYSATTVTDIYAAGDCTVSHDIADGTDHVLAIWPNAYLQGETAGVNMAGVSRIFTKAIPMNASGFMGLHMITAGSYDGEQYLEQDEQHYKLLITRDDRMVGFIMVGDVDRAGIYTSLIREQIPLNTIDFELICEKPQLMAFSRAERVKKLGGAH